MARLAGSLGLAGNPALTLEYDEFRDIAERCLFCSIEARWVRRVFVDARGEET